MKDKNLKKLLSDFECGLYSPTHKELFEIIFSYCLTESEIKKAAELVYEKLFCEGGIFNESPENLFVGKISNEYIPLIKALVEAMKISAKLQGNENTLSTHRYAGEFVKNFIGNAQEEGLYTVYLGELNNVLHAEKTVSGDLGSVFIDVDSMIKRAKDFCAKKVIIAHNHVSAYMNYSMEDYHATKKIESYFSASGIKLMEHFVISKGRYYGILFDLEGKNSWKE